MSQSEANAKYRKGNIPIPNTYWKVFTLSKDSLSFVEVGKVSVSGKRVSKEMNRHQSIKGYEPHDIAHEIACKKYPRTNPIIIERIYEDNKE